MIGGQGDAHGGRPVFTSGTFWIGPSPAPPPTPTTNHPPLKTVPYLIKKILIVFPELNAGNLQLPVGFRKDVLADTSLRKPTGRILLLYPLKKIFHYHYVLREEFPSDTYLGPSNNFYYFCRLILVFFTALQATHEDPDYKFPRFYLGKMIEKQWKWRPSRNNKKIFFDGVRRRYGNSANRLWRGQVLIIIRFSGSLT